MKIKMRLLSLSAVALGFLLAAPARSDDDWPMFGHDPRGTRYNSGEKLLGRSNVSSLHVRWLYPTPGIVAGTPAVVDGTLFDGDGSGNVYALDAGNGALRWKTAIEDASFTASPTVYRNRVVLGSRNNGVIYGLDRDTGAVVWRSRPNSYGRPAIYGSSTVVGRYVAIGVASNDETEPPPARSRGSLVLIDPVNGRVIWQTYMITAAQAARGSSGASIWTTPAFDPESNLIYVGTGNNFSDPPTRTSDAMIAFHADTGAIKWINQRTPNDVWTATFPTGPDYDFGDSPQVYHLPNGRKVVGEGQKSGFYHVLDAATGAVVHFQQFLPGSALGGFFTDSAVAHGMVFAPGNNTAGTPPGCALVAMTGDGTREVWRFETAGFEANGVAVANGVVYFKPSSDVNLYAFDFAGNKLAAIPVGGSNSGVTVAEGRVFLGLGDSFTNGNNYNAPGGIVALGP